MKKTNKKFIRDFMADYNNIVRELYEKEMIRDIKSHVINDFGEVVEITHENKSNESNILYDRHLPIEKIMNILLENKEYNLLLYDRSIIKYQFTIINGKICKERLIFIKKHNYLWTKDEINKKDIDDFGIDWFQEEASIPIVIRIDYDDENYEDIIHPITHMTLSNYEECRIPMMGAVTLYNFMNFVLNFFYNDSLKCSSVFEETNITISQNEKKRLHFEWE